MKTVTGQYLPPLSLKLIEKWWYQIKAEKEEEWRQKCLGFDRIQVRLLLRKPIKRVKKVVVVP